MQGVSLLCVLIGYFQLTMAFQMPGFRSVMNHRSSAMRMNAEPKEFASREEYLSYLKSISQLPKGFNVGATRFSFEPIEVKNKLLPMNMTLIHLDQPTDSFAAMFTSNAFPGGPILVGKERMAGSTHLQSILINNKISNVCPNGVSDRGYGDSDLLCSNLADELKLNNGKHGVFPSSTGIIGWRLPVKSMQAQLPKLIQSLQKESIYPAACGIMTTDRYPKVRSYRSSKGWSIVGIAKGAGMIEPNMATMLSYLLTDLNIPRSDLQEILKEAVHQSYNTISVDSDQSTSDTVCLVSSKQTPPADSNTKQEFLVALKQLCKQLSEDIVRNGEGTQHVIKVKLHNFPSDKKALGLLIGKEIVNSNLVKCAISGNDPNVGRIVAAIGSLIGAYPQESTGLNWKDLSLSLGGVQIFEKNGFQLDPTKEEQLYEYLKHCQLYPSTVTEHDRNYPYHSRSVELDVFFPQTTQPHEVIEVIGSDLTKEYVEINADYRS